MNTISIVSQDPIGQAEYRIGDARQVEWFSHYGPDGAGFGYLSFQLHRPSRNYRDIGYGYRVRVTRGPWLTLFDGQIVKITEETGQTDVITVWALGWIHVLSNDTFNRVYCDTRLRAWVNDEEPDGYHRPDKYAWSVDGDTLQLAPRRNVEILNGEYVALRYTMPFGEQARRIKSSYQLSIPAEWAGAGGHLQLAIHSEGTGEVWSHDAAGAVADLDLQLDDGSTWVEVRLYMTGDGGGGTHEREEDDVWGSFINLRVYSVDVPVLDAAIVAKELVAYLHGAGHGLSRSTSRIQSPGLALEPATFLDDATPLDILTWCCQFGDVEGRPVAFGVSFDESRTLFVEPYDLTAVRYVVNPARAGLSRTGDWGQSAQKVYGVMRSDTDLNQMVRTADVEASEVIAELGGHFRRQVVNLDGVVSSSQVAALLELYLRERGYPMMQGSYSVRGAVQTPDGRSVPVAEILPGGLVQVREWRAVEAMMKPDDYRDRTTTFLLVGIHVNLDTGEAELTPSESSDMFTRQMAIVQQLQHSR